MLRITEVFNDDKSIGLKLEGQLVGTWTPELERICLYHRDEENKTIALDFSDVTFIDKNGVKMLKKIKDERIKIINCPLFIRSLLSDLIMCKD